MSGLDIFMMRSIHDKSSGVIYDPFVATDGRVGYQVTRLAEGDAERTTYIYFNPSGGSDDGVPTVFVYMGDDNDPALDAPQHFYVPKFFEEQS